MNKNYTLIEKRELPEIKSVGYLYGHFSGASLLHIKNSDENKMFCATFRTPQYDDTGLPHILEHCVLNGSKKYPLRDPFGELAKGSLVTFLNAMTFDDKTMYPVASCNDKDFMNLMGVYLDSVFFPLIHEKKQAFLQEGWHYDLESPDSELKINGVVYNEMKGAMSDPMRVLYQRTLEALFPDNPYQFNSGGDPAAIPQLTYEAFKDFHKKYYHPSNSLLFLYGNMDAEKCMDFMDAEYLSKFTAASGPAAVKMQEPFAEAAYTVEEYPLPEGEAAEGKNYVSAAYVTGDYNDTLLGMSLEILNFILTETPASPLKKALMEREFGEQIIGIYEDQLCQPSLMFIVKNSANGAKELEKAISEVLASLVKDGIDKKFVESCINRIEFNIREKDFGRTPKGLVYLLHTLRGWPYGQNPFEKLSPLENIAEIRRRINAGESYFENVIKKYILENPHSAFVTLKPVPGLQAKRDASELERLRVCKNGFSSATAAAIADEKRALTESQNTPDTPEVLNSIPIVELSDIRKKAEEIPLFERDASGLKILHSPLDTDGIVYGKFIFDISGLTAEEIPLTGVLKQLLSKLDTKNYGFESLTSEINENLGGFDVNFECFAHAVEKTCIPALVIQAKALDGKAVHMFSLAGEVARNTLFDDKNRVKQLLSELKAEMESAFINRGNFYAGLRAASVFDKSALYRDLAEGVGFYQYLKKLLADFDNSYESLKTNIVAACDKIFAKPAATLSLTCPEETLNGVLPKIDEFGGKLSSNVMKLPAPQFTASAKEAFITESNVQYNAGAANFRDAGYKYDGALLALANVISEGYLYQEIRVKGGAYGYNASFTPDGLMTFYSYRDPNLERTYDVYQNCVEFLEKFNPGEREMLKYVLGAVNRLDRPLNPREKGELAAKRRLTGVTAEMVQSERDGLLSTTPEKIRSYAAMVKACINVGNICTFGSEAKIKENEGFFGKVTRI